MTSTIPKDAVERLRAELLDHAGDLTVGYARAVPKRLLREAAEALTQSPPPAEGHSGAEAVGELVEAADVLQLAAARVANKYGRDTVTDELLDWEEWRAVRERCEAVKAALHALAQGERK